jgi:purine catabolism regulator
MRPGSAVWSTAILRLVEAGIYDQLLEKMVPMQVPPMPDLGMFLRRLVVPIIVDRKVYGYIWIIVGDQPLTELNELAINHGATVAALIMLKEQAVREAQEAMRGDFLEQLLRGAEETAIFTEQARQLKYRLDRPHQVLLIQDRPKAGGNPHSLLDVVAYWLRAQNYQALLDRRDEGVVVIIESDHTAKGKQLAVTLVEDLNQAAHELLVGVGNACLPRNLDLNGVRRSYEEAREAVRVSTALGRRKGITVFGELGLLHWLYHLPPEQRAGNTYLQHVLTLATYDTKHKTELVKTLETYLDSGGSLVEAAAILYIHRNTLLHRLDRIEQLCAVHLRDPLERLNLHTAIKSYRLHGE